MTDPVRSPRGSGTLYLVVILLAAVLAIALASYVYRVTPGKRAELNVELYKVLVQLLAIALVGGVLTSLLGERSKAKEREAAAREKEKEHEAAARARAAERLQELNDLRLEMIARLVSATNVVRKAPLLIESHRSKKTYGEQIRAVVDAQLGLGLLRHEQENMRLFTNGAQITESIRQMESYLGSLIDEWKARYLDVPETGRDPWPVLQSFPVLADLLKGDSESRFESEYFAGYRKALQVMREDIFGAG
jgi:hypothetical protein